MQVRRSVVVLTGLAIGAAAWGAAAAPATAPVAAGPGSWVQLSSGTGVTNIVDPDVHRFGSDLQVVWTQGAGTDTALRTRLVATNGSAASSMRTIQTWASLNEMPAIIPHGDQRMVVFAGLRSTDSSDPYASGATYYATSGEGLTWTLGSGSLSASTYAYASYGSDATDAGGTPVAVFTAGSADDISFHVGLDSNPAANPDGVTQHIDGCCAYYAGTAFNPANGETWTVWYSNSGDAGTDGINAQRIAPTPGARLHAPKSTSSYAGSISSVAPIQRVGVVSSGGKLWTAYGVGYPTQNTIALWQLGAGSPLLLHLHHAVGSIGIAAAPGGRVWVFWAHKYTSQLEAARTDPGAHRFGRVCHIRSPHGTDSIWHTAGDGTNGRLDLVVNAGSGDDEAISSSQVLPCLSGRVSPRSVEAGDGVTITVTDAGDPVSNAKVHYAGTTKQTDRHGEATFAIARGTSKGKHTIAFGHGGYTGGSVTFRVT